MVMEMGPKIYNTERLTIRKLPKEPIIEQLASTKFQ